MVASTLYISAASALAFGLAAAQVNPDAEGACETTQGGADACGPNGSERWLNTGIDGDGWEPPFLDINNLSHISLDEYYGKVGSNCAQYDEFFQSSGAKYDIDPAILAFIAMQESSCNADAGGPTPGLMQCAPGNCQNGQDNCQYPIQDNVDCGAWVLRSGLDNNDGNAVKALGAYNGKPHSLFPCAFCTSLTLRRLLHGRLGPQRRQGPDRGLPVLGRGPRQRLPAEPGLPPRDAQRLVPGLRRVRRRLCRRRHLRLHRQLRRRRFLLEERRAMGHGPWAEAVNSSLVL